MAGKAFTFEIYIPFYIIPVLLVSSGRHRIVYSTILISHRLLFYHFETVYVFSLPFDDGGPPLFGGDIENSLYRITFA